MPEVESVVAQALPALWGGDGPDSPSVPSNLAMPTLPTFVTQHTHHSLAGWPERFVQALFGQDHTGMKLSALIPTFATASAWTCSFGLRCTRDPSLLAGPVAVALAVSCLAAARHTWTPLLGPDPVTDTAPGSPACAEAGTNSLSSSFFGLCVPGPTPAGWTCACLLLALAVSAAMMLAALASWRLVSRELAVEDLCSKTAGPQQCRTVTSTNCELQRANDGSPEADTEQLVGSSGSTASASTTTTAATTTTCTTTSHHSSHSDSRSDAGSSSDSDASGNRSSASSSVSGSSRCSLNNMTGLSSSRCRNNSHFFAIGSTGAIAYIDATSTGTRVSFSSESGYTGVAVGAGWRGGVGLSQRGPHVSIQALPGHAAPRFLPPADQGPPTAGFADGRAVGPTTYTPFHATERLVPLALPYSTSVRLTRTPTAAVPPGDPLSAIPGPVRASYTFMSLSTLPGPAGTSGDNIGDGSGASSGTPRPAMPPRYMSLTRLVSTRVKIRGPGAEPEAIAPGYQRRIEAMVAAAGQQLEGVYVRRGCIELIVDSVSLVLVDVGGFAPSTAAALAMAMAPEPSVASTATPVVSHPEPQALVQALMLPPEGAGSRSHTAVDWERPGPKRTVPAAPDFGLVAAGVPQHVSSGLVLRVSPCCVAPATPQDAEAAAAGCGAPPDGAEDADAAAACAGPSPCGTAHLWVEVWSPDGRPPEVLARFRGSFLRMKAALRPVRLDPSGAWVGLDTAAIATEEDRAGPTPAAEGGIDEGASAVTRQHDGSVEAIRIADGGDVVCSNDGDSDPGRLFCGEVELAGLPPGAAGLLILEASVGAGQAALSPASPLPGTTGAAAAATGLPGPGVLTSAPVPVLCVDDPWIVEEVVALAEALYAAAAAGTAMGTSATEAPALADAATGSPPAAAVAEVKGAVQERRRSSTSVDPQELSQRQDQDQDQQHPMPGQEALPGSGCGSDPAGFEAAGSGLSVEDLEGLILDLGTFFSRVHACRPARHGTGDDHGLPSPPPQRLPGGPLGDSPPTERGLSVCPTASSVLDLIFLGEHLMDWLSLSAAVGAGSVTHGPAFVAARCSDDVLSTRADTGAVAGDVVGEREGTGGSTTDGGLWRATLARLQGDIAFLRAQLAPLEGASMEGTEAGVVTAGAAAAKGAGGGDNSSCKVQEPAVAAEEVCGDTDTPDARLACSDRQREAQHQTTGCNAEAKHAAAVSQEEGDDDAVAGCSSGAPLRQDAQDLASTAVLTRGSVRRGPLLWLRAVRDVHAMLYEPGYQAHLTEYCASLIHLVNFFSYFSVGALTLRTLQVEREWRQRPLLAFLGFMSPALVTLITTYGTTLLWLVLPRPLFKRTLRAAQVLRLVTFLAGAGLVAMRPKDAPVPAIVADHHNRASNVILAEGVAMAGTMPIMPLTNLLLSAVRVPVHTAAWMRINAYKTTADAAAVAVLLGCVAIAFNALLHTCLMMQYRYRRARAKAAKAQ